MKTPSMFETSSEAMTRAARDLAKHERPPRLADPPPEPTLAAEVASFPRPHLLDAYWARYGRTPHMVAGQDFGDLTAELGRLEASQATAEDLGRIEARRLGLTCRPTPEQWLQDQRERRAPPSRAPAPSELLAAAAPPPRGWLLSQTSAACLVNLLCGALHGYGCAQQLAPEERAAIGICGDPVALRQRAPVALHSVLAGHTDSASCLGFSLGILAYSQRHQVASPDIREALGQLVTHALSPASVGGGASSQLPPPSSEREKGDRG